MILTVLAASVIGGPSAANWVGEITIAAGCEAAAFSSALSWPGMSASLCAPSAGTLTPRSWPALRAPASTICQYCAVVSLTMIGIVSAARAGETASSGSTAATAPAINSAARRPASARTWRDLPTFLLSPKPVFTPTGGTGHCGVAPLGDHWMKDRRGCQRAKAAVDRRCGRV